MADQLPERKGFSRRTVAKGAAALGAAAAAGAAGYYALSPKKGSEAAPKVRLVIGKDAARSVTVQWAGEDSGKLELRGPGGAVQAFEPLKEERRAYGKVFHLNCVRISGLEPATAYEYRIPGIQGEWTSFKTAAEDCTSALIFPDSQSTDHYATWNRLYQGALSRNPDADFTVNMGDLVDCGAWMQHWEDWFAAVKGGIERVPLAPVMGNHDTYNENANIGEPLVYLAAFAVPETGSRYWNRWYYAFDSGPVHYIVLNTQWREADVFRKGLLPEMKAWFREEAAKTEKPWTVVMMHRNAIHYNIKGRKATPDLFSAEGRELMPLFDEAGVDLVLTAHLHTYRNRGHIRGFKRDAKGPLYILTGVAGNIRYPDFWIGNPLDEYVAPQPETDNYLRVDADAKQLRIRCFLPDGTQIDESVLEKA